jgi:VanZ family protein
VAGVPNVEDKVSMRGQPADALPTAASEKNPSRLSRWGSVIGYCALIFFLSSQSDLTLPEEIPASDKFAHLVEYGVLGWLWARAVIYERPGWSAMAIVLSALAFAGGYGLSDEWHQFYVPGRFADLLDAIVDACGGALGGGSYLLWLRTVPRTATRQRIGREEGGAG